MLLDYSVCIPPALNYLKRLFVAYELLVRLMRQPEIGANVSN